MAKNKGLHISKADLIELIQTFTCSSFEEAIVSEKILNPANNQCRYTIRKDNANFLFDAYYNSNNTITPRAVQGEGYEISQELVAFVMDNVDYKDVVSGNFTCTIDHDKFIGLIDYIRGLKGVTLANKEDKGNNGEIYQFISEIGDKITLTYYSTTCKLRFQGFLMKLHVEVKCFLNAYTYVETKITNCITDKETAISNKLRAYLPNSFGNLDELLSELLYDSMAQTIWRLPVNDFSIWTFPALKSLEGRIKQIFSFSRIRINDKAGFSINGAPAFTWDGTKFNVNTGIISIQDVNTLSVLSDCYTFWNKNRHNLFHVKQQIVASRTIQSPEEAENIILGVCTLFENSYNILGK